MSVTHTYFRYHSIPYYTANTQTQKNLNIAELVEDNTSIALRMHVPCSYDMKWYDNFYMDVE